MATWRSAPVLLAMTKRSKPVEGAFAAAPPMLAMVTFGVPAVPVTVRPPLSVVRPVTPRVPPRLVAPPEVTVSAEKRPVLAVVAPIGVPSMLPPEMVAFAVMRPPAVSVPAKLPAPSAPMRKRSVLAVRKARSTASRVPRKSSEGSVPELPRSSQKFCASRFVRLTWLRAPALLASRTRSKPVGTVLAAVPPRLAKVTFGVPAVPVTVRPPFSVARPVTPSVPPTVVLPLSAEAPLTVIVLAVSPALKVPRPLKVALVKVLAPVTPSEPVMAVLPVMAALPVTASEFSVARPEVLSVVVLRPPPTVSGPAKLPAPVLPLMVKRVTLFVFKTRSTAFVVPTKLLASALALPPSAQKLPTTSDRLRRRTTPLPSTERMLSVVLPFGRPSSVSGFVPPVGLIVKPPEALTVKTSVRLLPLRPCSSSSAPELPFAPFTTNAGVLLALVLTSRMAEGATGSAPALMARRPVAKSP